MMLNQVTIKVTDMKDSIAFYQRLGLKLIVRNEDDSYARFECPGGSGSTFSLLKADAKEVGGGGVSICFECQDIDGTVEKLAASGVDFETQPKDMPWLWREAKLKDPDGYDLCLYYAGVNRRFPPWRLASAPTS